MKNNKEKTPLTIKAQIGLRFIIIFRLFISVLFSDYMYPNTNNLIEAMLIDLSPLIIVLFLTSISSFVYRRTLQLFSAFSSADKSIDYCFFIPTLVIIIFVFLPERSKFANMFNEDYLVTPMMNLPALAQGILDTELFLSERTFLGYNALEFVKTFLLIVIFACITYSILKLLLKFYQISIANKQIHITTPLKIELLLFSLIALIFNMVALFYATISVSPQIFSDYEVSADSFAKLFDALYLAVIHLFNIGIKEPTSIFGKLLIMTLPIINLSFFTVFITSVFNKENEKVQSKTNSSDTTVSQKPSNKKRKKR